MALGKDTKVKLVTAANPRGDAQGTGALAALLGWEEPGGE